MSVVTLSQEERRKRNKELEQKALKRLKDRAAPFFGAAEKDVLFMKTQLTQLVNTNNQNVKFIQDLMKKDTEKEEKLKEFEYMTKAIIDCVVSKGLCTEQEMHEAIRQRQLNDMQIQEVDSSVQDQSLITMKFKIFDGDKLIDDKSLHPMMYKIGSGKLSCEQEMIGMKKGEVRKFDIVFGPGFKIPELIGKPLQIEIDLCGVHKEVKGNG